MKRLTSNNTFEMDLVQLALNQVYIEDGWAWYQGGVPEHDVSVCDLIRTAADTLLVELPMLSDEDLSHLMVDWLQYGEEEPEGVLAILYRALCAQAELRDKLSRYEDTELEPEEVTAIKHALMGQEIAKITEFEGIPIQRLQELAQAEKDGRLVVLPPNDPLTLEELREMDGEPVWVRNHCTGDYRCRVINSSGEHFTHFTDGGLNENRSYGSYWTAYRRKPEEAAP